MYCDISLKKSFMLYKIKTIIMRLVSKKVIKMTLLTLDKTDSLDKMQNLLNDVHKLKIDLI